MEVCIIACMLNSLNICVCYPSEFDDNVVYDTLLGKRATTIYCMDTEFTRKSNEVYVNGQIMCVCV